MSLKSRGGCLSIAVHDVSSCWRSHSAHQATCFLSLFATVNLPKFCVFIELGIHDPQCSIFVKSENVANALQKVLRCLPWLHVAPELFPEHAKRTEERSFQAAWHWWDLGASGCMRGICQCASNRFLGWIWQQAIWRLRKDLLCF